MGRRWKTKEEWESLRQKVTQQQQQRMTQCAWSHGQKRNAAKVYITDTLMFKDRYRRKHESVKDDRHKARNAKDTSAWGASTTGGQKKGGV
ncbi:hypothetical protein RUM44_002141 [Polyplax serrata]|uniref:Uncharacterized protein n=1 Tax=Polyplax serrata TaxID=468196 RepID=A0ABR1AM10_POLSC